MTAKIKLNAASGGGSISIQAPSSSSNNRVISLPDITDGTLLTSQSSLDSTKLSPAIAAGITEADQWRVTSDFTMGQTAANITSNWERNDTNFEKIGTGMSVDGSTGHWTFPSTGKWLIQVHWIGERSTGATHWGYHYIFGMQDGNQSNGYELAKSYIGNAANNNRNTAFMQCIFDVTNTSTHKVLFGYYDYYVQTTVYKGNTSRNENSYTFIKLGET